MHSRSRHWGQAPPPGACIAAPQFGHDWFSGIRSCGTIH
jgi:hypothetical protein